MIGYDEGTVDGAPYPSRPLLCSTKSHPYPFAYTSSDPSYEQQHAVIPCVTLDCLVLIPLLYFYAFSKSCTRLRLTQSHNTSEPFPDAVKIYSLGLWKQMLRRQNTPPSRPRDGMLHIILLPHAESKRVVLSTVVRDISACDLRNTEPTKTPQPPIRSSCHTRNIW